MPGQTDGRGPTDERTLLRKDSPGLCKSQFLARHCLTDNELGLCLKSLSSTRTTNRIFTPGIWRNVSPGVRTFSNLNGVNFNCVTNELKMASQETANTAAESATDRKENMVKSNATLPPGFRARPQGPPGSPRNPLNNGPIGQPRPGGQPPPHIRFDSRAPLRPSGPGQIIQLRPYGQPRPPGNQLSQKLPQQAQNPPIVLNPRFAPSPINNRTGPQQRPRLPQPGNFQGQQYQRNAQQPLHPGFEHSPPPPPQTRNPDILARPQEIAQRQLQRNESLLSFPPSPLTQKENRKPPVPRIVVERMADVDNARKLQQIENSVPKEKIRETTENDDDDDVVVDGKKSPRPDSSNESVESRAGNKETTQSPRRPETATINGKMDVKPKIEDVEELRGKTDAKIMDNVIEKMNDKMDSKPKDKITEEINDKVDTKMKDKTAEELSDKHINNIAASAKPDVLENGTCKIESAKNSAGIKNGLSSPKLEPRAESSDKQHKAEDKGEQKESAHKTIENENINKKVDAGKELRSEEEKRIASPMPEVKDVKASESAAKSSNEDKQNEQELDTKSPDKSVAPTPIDANQNQKEQQLKTPSKSPDKSRSSTPTESTEKQKDELKTPSKSADTSRSTTPMNNNQVGQLKTPSKSPEKSRASTPADVKPSENEEESKELNKTPVKSQASTPAEANEVKGASESKSNESKPAEASDDKKAQEPKTMDESVDKKVEHALEEKSQREEEPKASMQMSEKSEEHLNEKQSRDSAVGASEESSKTTEESEKESVRKPVQDSLEPKTISPSASSSPAKETSPSASPASVEAASPSASATSIREASPSSASTKEAKTSPTPSESQGKLLATESILSTPKSPEDSVKGFDNGQRRSLSPKSPALSSPQSPLSPKSPTISEKSVVHEKKKATFVESSDEKEVNDEKKTRSKPSTPRIQRAPTPAHVDEKSGKKTVTAATGIENGNAMEDSSQPNAIPATNGVEDSPTKKSPSKSKDADKRSTAGSPVKSPNKSIKSLPRTPETPSSTAGQEKKMPMNKVQVGAAPSPNLKTVRSKIGSLENTSYKPGGGNVKIENRKLDFSKAQPKIAAKNEKYTPSGGDKKISQVKLQWNAKSKVGSLENATHKPGGGDKKIETVKLDFKDKAKSKVGSKDNAKHVPGGGNIKSSATPPKTPQDTSNDIQTQKIDIKAESKIGSMDNVKHRPGGGDKKIFNDRDYLRQSGSNVESLCASGSQIENTEEVNSLSTEPSKENLPQPPPTTPTKTRKLPSPSSMVTSKAVRNSFAKSSEATESKKNSLSKDTAKAVSESKKNLNLENGKTATEDRTPKSPTSTECSNLKSPNKSSLRTPRKTSPKNIRFPKLAPSPVPPEAVPVSETHSKISLPKLIEHSAQLNSVTH
ncbi:microtubule-associated protein tau isoform X2 [Nomia melanderi]|uniref:microtubule-associated protein tau isoform X2 n=1 Tax=Nomia melanderi TaxID=2448451 RepID=UPI003FCCCC46